MITIYFVASHPERPSQLDLYRQHGASWQVWNYQWRRWEPAARSRDGLVRDGYRFYEHGALVDPSDHELRASLYEVQDRLLDTADAWRLLQQQFRALQPTAADRDSGVEIPAAGAPTASADPAAQRVVAWEDARDLDAEPGNRPEARREDIDDTPWWANDATAYREPAHDRPVNQHGPDPWRPSAAQPARASAVTAEPAHGDEPAAGRASQDEVAGLRAALRQPLDEVIIDSEDAAAVRRTYYVAEDQFDGVADIVGEAFTDRGVGWSLSLCEDGRSWLLTVDDSAPEFAAQLSALQTWDPTAHPHPRDSSYGMDDQRYWDDPPDTYRQPAHDAPPSPAGTDPWRPPAAQPARTTTTATVAPATDEQPRAEPASEDEVAALRAAVRQLPDGMITDDDGARIGVTPEQFSRLVDLDMDEEADIRRDEIEAEEREAALRAELALRGAEQAIRRIDEVTAEHERAELADAEREARIARWVREDPAGAAGADTAREEEVSQR